MEGDALEVAESRGTLGLIVDLEGATFLCDRAFRILAIVGARLAESSRSFRFQSQRYDKASDLIKPYLAGL